LKWAKEGKTFIYVHPDFVAVDTKTWQILNKRERVPKIAYYDEYDDFTPETEAILKKILKTRLK
jgi:hypothetical protein